jgi:hypothetical protein
LISVSQACSNAAELKKPTAFEHRAKSKKACGCLQAKWGLLRFSADGSGGILGVIVLLAMMIGLGVEFGWILYLFDAFLLLKGVKMWAIADHVPDIANNPLLASL